VNGSGAGVVAFAAPNSVHDTTNDCGFFRSRRGPLSS
jgi:hypothetical protein